MTFKEFQKEAHNYDCITTFWEDFSKADRFGVEAVIDTFNRAFNEWKSNYKYLTELAIVMNHKCWIHFNKKNITLSNLYSDRYYKVRSYAIENLKGKELKYYLDTTD